MLFLLFYDRIMKILYLIGVWHRFTYFGCVRSLKITGYHLVTLLLIYIFVPMVVKQLITPI